MGTVSSQVGARSLPFCGTVCVGVASNSKPGGGVCANPAQVMAAKRRACSFMGTRPIAELYQSKRQARSPKQSSGRMSLRLGAVPPMPGAPFPISRSKGGNGKRGATQTLFPLAAELMAVKRRGAVLLQRLDELLDAHSRLPKHSAQRAAFDGPVHGHHHDSPIAPAHDVMRAGLMIRREPKTAQRLHGIVAVDVAGQLHAMASAGSSTKCRRTVRGGTTPAAWK